MPRMGGAIMTYSVVTAKCTKVTSTWRKDHFEIMTEPACGGFQVEWAFTLDYAVHRFQWLVTNS